MSNYVPPNLPLKVDLESKVVLKQVAAAHRRLAELKGLVLTIPNEEILISTLTLQEARDSSEIENIITTQDELFKAELFTDYAVNVSTKEFESIHPFYDGNGRTGRIINILYLVCKDLLQLPILYLSRYIVEHKTEYYRLLQEVRDHNQWEEWILFMLKGVEETSIQTIGLIKDIKKLMQEYKEKIRNELPKIYSQELLNNLFKHPYTKIEFVIEDVRVSRPTATGYLESLVMNGFLEKYRIGKSNFYLNRNLFNLFVNAYQNKRD